MRITSSERKLGEWKRVRVVDVAAREICGEPFDLGEFLRCWAVILDTIEGGATTRIYSDSRRDFGENRLDA